MNAESLLWDHPSKPAPPDSPKAFWARHQKTSLKPSTSAISMVPAAYAPWTHHKGVRFLPGEKWTRCTQNPEATTCTSSKFTTDHPGSSSIRRRRILPPMYAQHLWHRASEYLPLVVFINSPNGKNYYPNSFQLCSTITSLVLLTTRTDLGFINIKHGNNVLGDR